MLFEPIAIIGRGILLPGAASPFAFWKNRLAGQVSLAPATHESWGLDPKSILDKTGKKSDSVCTDTCGVIQGFDTRFDPEGFNVSAQEIKKWDSLTKWLLYAGREALREAELGQADVLRHRAGVIVGNLGYPTRDLMTFAESVWLKQPETNTHPAHRFMSGLPIRRMANALGFHHDAFALDAACASALFAIQLGCQQLQAGKADLMLTGGINAVDSLFLQMGFAALDALSKSGQSQPLQSTADGLIPSQGAALVLLKRLDDAIRDRNPILGVIRGIGLSNDGKGAGLLVPTEAGQIKAMQQAYAVSQLSPDQISWIECHATGTPLGDTTEIQSMEHIFGHERSLAIGSLKTHIGHTITASGAAALISVLSAFAEGIKPAHPAILDNPLPRLRKTAFRALAQSISWETKDEPRRAAINCFGFGGNNAHLIVEEWCPASRYRSWAASPASVPLEDIAVVGLSIMTATTSLSNKKERSCIDEVLLPIQGIPFPPVDLKCALGQQLLILNVYQDALSQVTISDRSRSQVLIGMQCDVEVARTGLRWRMPTLFKEENNTEWLENTRNKIHEPIKAAHVVGYMANIVANRLNHILDFKGASYSIFAEELSGIIALEQAIGALQRREIDLALVGAVDVCCEEVHEWAAKEMLPASHRRSGDAAVMLVLKRANESTAREKNWGLISVVDSSENSDDVTSSTKPFGHAHAASGLLQVAHHLVEKRFASFTLTGLGGMQKAVSLKPLEGQTLHQRKTVYGSVV